MSAIPRAGSGSMGEIRQPPPSVPGRAVVETDPAQNLLRIAWQGDVDGAVVQSALQKVELCLRELRPRFVTLVDLALLHRLDRGAVPSLAALMERLRHAGVAKVVRVLPDRSKDIGLNILSIIHYRGKVPIRTVSSRSDAERELTIGG